MKQKILTCLVLSILFGPVFAQNTYTILAEDAAGLWGQADGSGAGNDIVKAAFAAMGDKAILEIVPYNRCKTYVLNGQALACFGMSNAEELEGKVIFSESPIYATTSTIFVRKADAQKYKSAADIQSNTHIGTVTGYEYPDAIVHMIKTGVLIPDHAPSELHSLKKLAAGRFTLVVANLDELKNANYLMKQAGVTDSVQLAFEMESSGTFLGFSTSHPKSAAAIKSFNAGMALIKKNGTLNKILMTWKSKLSD